MLFSDNRFQWDRLENLLRLAKEGIGGPGGVGAAALPGGLDLSATVTDGARVRRACMLCVMRFGCLFPVLFR